MRSLALALAAFFLVSTMPAAEAGPPHCPPGHAKKGWCKPGKRYSLPPGVRYQYIRDYDRYELRRPPAGHVHVIVDEEVFLVLDATKEVVEAIGAVNRLLRY